MRNYFERHKEQEQIGGIDIKRGITPTNNKIFA